MPRKPTRRSLVAQPLTFSKFARSVAHCASAYMMMMMRRHQMPQRPTCCDHGNGCGDHAVGENSRGSESSEEEGELQADFAFFDPKPDDFHGVKTLLQTYLDKKEWDLSGFVDLILGQTTVGTVVKIEDCEDDALFSVVTAMNLRRYKDNKCMMQVKDFLLKVCPDECLRSDLKLLLKKDAHNVGLLVSQRVVNLPLQLLPHLYDGLFDEVSWATEDEPTEELRKSFCFKTYIMISKIYMGKNAKRKKQTNQTDEDVIYVKVEDEIFKKLSSWSFFFPLHTEQVLAEELRNYRPMGLVMAVEADKIPKFRKQLHSLINQP